MTHTV